MPNRAIKDQRDDSRPKVGPADPDTRRRLLQERLAEREPNRYGKGEKTVAKPPQPESATKDLSAYGAARKLIGRKAQIDRAADESN